MARWRATTISLPLLESSTRARAKEEGEAEVEGGGSGPYLWGGEFSGEEGGEFSGEGVGLGKKKGSESENRPGWDEERMFRSGILGWSRELKG